jgi:tetratricopeptide (TPR) repeat protein
MMTERKRSGSRASRRNATRRWCIPPALEHEPEELLEGSQVLDEFPGPAGLVLWQSLRDVTLWAAVDEAKRRAMFVPEAAHRRLTELLQAATEPALEVSLTSLVAVVGSPETASEDVVSLVCLQVSRWAEARGAMGTAMAFAQAGALASPLDPSASLAAGSVALRWRRSARAETWLRRTIGLARRTHDWEPYAQAYVEMGILYARRGQLDTAERYLLQGLRASRRHGLIAVRGAALHALLNLAMETGALEEADRYARGALRAYGRGHPRTAELVHDMAVLWVRAGVYDRAVAALQKLLPTRVDPVERALSLAMLAHAAAGADDPLLYQESWMDAWAMIHRRPGEEHRHARALLELARASALRKDWAHVEQAVRVATTATSPHTDEAVSRQVEELAAALRQRRA